jgi:hypothetical protein
MQAKARGFQRESLTGISNYAILGKNSFKLLDLARKPSAMRPNLRQISFVYLASLSKEDCKR